MLADLNKIKTLLNVALSRLSYLKPCDVRVRVESFARLFLFIAISLSLYISIIMFTFVYVSLLLLLLLDKIFFVYFFLMCKNYFFSFLFY